MRGKSLWIFSQVSNLHLQFSKEKEWKNTMKQAPLIFYTPLYKSARKAYVAQCTFEYLSALLVSDAFLAKLLASIGIRDSLIGIISSFISLAFVVQLLSLAVSALPIDRKKTVVAFNAVSQLLFCSLYLIPFLPVGAGAKTVLVIVGVLLAFAGQYIASPICYQWANSYVDPDHRAEYSAVKEIISLLSGMVFSAALGYIIDCFEGLGNLNGAFLFIACCMLITALLNIASLLLIKGDGKKQTAIPLRGMGKETLGNPKFRRLVVMTILWNCAQYFSVGFLGVFKTKDLLLPLFTVQIINIAGQLARMLVSVPFGRYSDRKGFARGFELAAAIAGAGFLTNIFITQSLWFLIVIQALCYNIAMAGTNANAFNITYHCVDPQYIAQAIAIKSSIGGICGFLAALLAGKVVSYIRDAGDTLFGLPVFPQQILSVVSLLLTVATVLYIKLALEKETEKAPR